MTVQELYDSIGGNYDSAKRILQMDKLIGKFVLKFLDDKSCEKLLSAWEAKDGSGVFDGAHAIKGVCANLGLNGLSEQASAIAEEFRPGNARTMDDAEVDRLVAELKATYDKTIAGISAFAAEQ
ncbi:MAG: Hpt domain-containing protein [Oscillospiraceae bacterium]|nr:Hpt domain-containing protein [Oscillospiraceae bacterium]